MTTEEVSRVVFDKKRLTKDIIATFSRLTDGKTFLGHDRRKYRLVYSGDRPAAEGFFDVVVKHDGVTASVASYAVVLIGISAH
jgi:hypothetical protein